MLELALSYDKELMTVKNIAVRQSISEKYIEQIISILNKSGLVRSQRGSSGGYRLAREPESITVDQILVATEGPLHLADCVGENGRSCPKRDQCVTAEIWLEMEDALRGIAGRITLRDLVNRYNKNSGYSYVI